MKVDSEGSVERRKAQLVAQGFFQKFGLDYDETFCPVVRFVRIVISLAVQNSLKLHRNDSLLEWRIEGGSLHAIARGLCC